MKLFIILAACIAAVYGALPANIFEPKCPRNDPETSECLRRGIENIRPYLKTGVPDLNIPGLEPFKMPKLDLDIDIRSSMLIKGEATNIVAHGGSNFQVMDLKYKVDGDNHLMELIINLPNLSVSADYDSTGSKFIGLETSGKGQFRATFADITATIKTSGHSVKRMELEFIELDDVTLNIKFGNSKLHVEPVEKTFITNAVSAFIKGSGSAVIDAITPYIIKAATPIVRQYLSEILSVVPLSDIFSM